MTVTAQNALRRVPEPAPSEATGLEYKTTGVQPVGEIVGVDEAEGLVTAIVSVTGVKDHVKDRIHPGSYAATLAARRPKVAHHHDWKNPVGRIEEVTELPPGSPELPERTGDGKPWPQHAGALKATMRYNLDKQAGRDAFADVLFYSKNGECEWSIGYRVPKGKATRSKDGIREIKAIDLYEISFVLFGAAPGTGTLAVKDAAQATEDPAATAVEVEPLPAAPIPVQDGGQPTEPETDPDGDAEDGDGGAEDGEDAPVDGDGTRDSDAAAQPPEGDVNTADDGTAVDWDELDREADRLTADPDDDDGEDGDGEGDAAVASGDTDVDEKGLAAQPVFDADIKRAFSPGKRRDLAKSGNALPDGSYPIANIADLKNAIKAFGRAKPEDRSKVKAHIVKRARALGRTDLLPDGWGGGGKGPKKKPAFLDGKALDAVGDAAEAKMAHESLNRSPRKNWVEVVGQLPAYIQHIAKDLHEEKGMPLDQAIPTAISAVKRWASGAGNVKADTRAKAAKAVAEWEKLKAKAAFRRLTSGAKTDAVLENRPQPGDVPDSDVLESAGAYPHLPGTFEEIRAQLAKALTGRPGPGTPLVSIDATWTDRTIATWFPPGHPEDARSFEVPYRFDDEGKVWIGEPEEVTLTVAGVEDAPFPHTGVVEALTDELKTYLLHEGKAGRVLSTSNANHLKGAVEQLVAVLAAAGIVVMAADEPPASGDDGTGNPDTTAPANDPEPAMVKVDPALRARAIAAYVAAQE